MPASRMRAAGCARESVWLAVALALPVLFNPWGYNSFELPKALFLRTLALAAALLALSMATTHQSAGRPRPRDIPQPLRWAVLTYGAVLALATALSVNPRASLWGSYERQFGLLTQGAIVGLFWFTAAYLRDRAQVERLWCALVWGSAPVVLYGLAQAARLDPLDWHTDAASPVLSTVGRANFVGSYLVMVVPLTAHRLLSVRSSWQRGLTGLLLAGQLATLALAQARAAWVGLGAAAMAFGLGHAWVQRSRRLAVVCVMLAVLALGGVLALNWLWRRAGVGGWAPLERLATLARTDAGSSAARLTIWRAATPLALARPWLGYGPETLRTVFARVYPPQLVYYQGRHIAVDRAHNIWLDLALSAGLAGVAAYAALLAGLLRLVWQALHTRADRTAAWVALSAALVGHLADMQFGFAVTTGAAVFWLLVALAVGLHRAERVSGKPAEMQPGTRGLLLWWLPPVLAALALAYFVCLRPLLADVVYGRYRAEALPQAEREAAAIQAVRLWPLEPEYRLEAAWALMAGDQFQSAEAHLAAAERLSPDDPLVWALRAELHAQWAASAPAHWAQAEAACRQALELAPNVAAYHTALGLVLTQQGQLEAGLAELERAVALDATDGTAYRHLAEVYRVLGRADEAVQALSEADRWEREGGDDG